MISHVNTDDTRLSHSFLNYLNAGAQGRFAGLNMLEQLGVPQNPEMIAELKKQLKDVAFWYQELWSGGSLFSSNWDKPETFEARKALRYLGDLRDDLRNLAADLRSIYSSRPVAPIDRTLACLLTAALGRAQYSKDNYLRGLLKLGEFLSEKTLVDESNDELKEHKVEMEFSHALLTALKENDNFSADLSEALLEEAAPLAGVFGGHIHDLNQLLSRYTGEFDYSMTEIPFDEQGDWKSIGAPAAAAGYWHAHGFNAAQTIEWRRLGFLDHSEAGLWKTYGFSPEEAAPWNFAKFPPKVAMQWIKANFIPEQALRLLELGFRSPGEVSAEKAEEVRQEITRPFEGDD